MANRIFLTMVSVVFLLSISLMGSPAIGGSAPNDSGPGESEDRLESVFEIALIGVDPSQRAAVVVEPDALEPRRLSVGDRLTGDRWHAELMYLTQESAYFDATVDLDGTVRQITLIVETRRSGHALSEVRVIDPGSEDASEASAVSPTVSPITIPSQAGSNQTAYGLSRSKGLQPHSINETGSAHSQSQDSKDPDG